VKVHAFSFPAWTLVLASGCGAADGSPEAPKGEGGQAGCVVDHFATEVVDHEFGTGQSFGQESFPDPILGPPRGLGSAQGSLDVVSLGNGGWVVVAFGESRIVDEAGPDFIVFENPFWLGGNPDAVFAELATVAVSEDGEEWREFPCDALEAPYGACAGWRPVFANADNEALDRLDPATAGGDAYDLGDVELAEARFVRITDRADLTGANGVFDLDAVGVVHGSCP